MSSSFADNAKPFIPHADVLHVRSAVGNHRFRSVARRPFAVKWTGLAAKLLGQHPAVKMQSNGGPDALSEHVEIAFRVELDAGQ
jgi:hypothetical protein